MPTSEARRNPLLGYPVMSFRRAKRGGIRCPRGADFLRQAQDRLSPVARNDKPRRQRSPGEPPMNVRQILAFLFAFALIGCAPGAQVGQSQAPSTQPRAPRTLVMVARVE